MALRDIFRKKKTPLEEKVIEKPIEKPSEIARPKVKKEVKIGEAYRILKSPHITEKATDLTKKNQYVFKIFPAVNKAEIKKAVENLYGVDVVSVKVINIASKKRRLGKTKGFKKGYKKAIIGIKEGQKIEVMPR